jgi:hypothetical protein
MVSGTREAIRRRPGTTRRRHRLLLPWFAVPFATRWPPPPEGPLMNNSRLIDCVSPVEQTHMNGVRLVGQRQPGYNKNGVRFTYRSDEARLEVNWPRFFKSESDPVFPSAHGEARRPMLQC